jgi:FkbM family methyltransferase
MIYRGSENGDLEFMKRFLKTGMVYVDVGAYHGLYAVVAGRQVGRSGRVVLFEPSISACRRARLNLLLNRVDGEIENSAVTDVSGVVLYHQVIRGYKTMGALRRPASDDPVRAHHVKSVSLDDYCHIHSVGRVDLLKIDAEGAELGVLSGASHVLEKLRPVIICEVLDWVTEPWGYLAKDIVTKLSSYEYEWYDIDCEGALTKHVNRKVYSEIRNYLAVPIERTEFLRSTAFVS